MYSKFITNKALLAEVHEIMSHNFDDYYAEEYDSRYDYDKYNAVASTIGTDDFGSFCNLLDTNDFTTMCVLVATGIA